MDVVDVEEAEPKYIGAEPGDGVEVQGTTEVEPIGANEVRAHAHCSCEG